MQLYKVSISLFIIIVVLNGCRHKCQDATNIDCENFDPCTQEHVTSADFTMTESYSYYDEHTNKNEKITMETDTTCWGVELKAKYDADYYEWHVGTDTAVRHSKSFYLDLSLNAKGYGLIDITLITKRYKPSKCFPDDDGADTVKRTLYSLGYYKDKPICGKYYGHFDTKPDSNFTIQVFVKGKISNLERLCTIDTINDVRIYSYFFAIMESDCSVPVGAGRLNKETRELIIDYSIADQYFNIYKKRFIGTQIK